jgi:SNF2 family DNA or RNA helicase
MSDSDDDQWTPDESETKAPAIRLGPASKASNTIYTDADASTWLLQVQHLGQELEARQKEARQMLESYIVPLKAQLKDYQKEGVEWMLGLRLCSLGGILGRWSRVLVACVAH